MVEIISTNQLVVSLPSVASARLQLLSGCIAPRTPTLKFEQVFTESSTYLRSKFGKIFKLSKNYKSSFREFGTEKV